VAFLHGDYREAMRLANHAIADAPRDAKARELMSLALFAVGEYRGAAFEAHYALQRRPAADWPTLYGYYQNLDRYTQHLNRLSKYLEEHADTAHAVFLLAYHNLMLGHKDSAQTGFTKTLALTPDDEVARSQLDKLVGKAEALHVPEPPNPPMTHEPGAAFPKDDEQKAAPPENAAQQDAAPNNDP
jgi:tetratricopeptide (TPR) repeat protein